MKTVHKRKGRLNKLLLAEQSERRKRVDWDEMSETARNDERKRIVGILKNLFDNSRLSFYQLLLYYRRRERPSRDAMKELKALGLINEKDQIDTIPHEILYEITYAAKPYWVK